MARVIQEKVFLLKRFLIKHWIRIHLKKATTISAPMSIAAFNIDGLIIHKMFLPMNMANIYALVKVIVLKTFKRQIKTVELFNR